MLYYNFLNQSPTHKHAGHSLSLTITNNATVSILIHVSFYSDDYPYILAVSFMCISKEKWLAQLIFILIGLAIHTGCTVYSWCAWGCSSPHIFNDGILPNSLFFVSLESRKLYPAVTLIYISLINTFEYLLLSSRTMWIFLHVNQLFYTLCPLSYSVVESFTFSGN